MRTLLNGPKTKRYLKLFHVLFGGGSLGLGVALLYFLTHRTNGDMGETESVFAFLLFDRILIFFLTGSLVTGFLFSLFTVWGFLRHPWIAVKWAVTLMVIFPLIFLLGPDLSGLSAIADASSGSLQSALPVALLEMEPGLLTRARIYSTLLTAALLLLFWFSFLKPWKAWKEDLVPDRPVVNGILLGVSLLAGGITLAQMLYLESIRRFEPPAGPSPRDGLYAGEVTCGGLLYQSRFRIENGKIRVLSLESERNTAYFQFALPIVDRINRRGSLDVDTITGATTTGKCILKSLAKGKTQQP